MLKDNTAVEVYIEETEKMKAGSEEHKTMEAASVSKHGQLDKKLKVNKLNVTLYKREYFRNNFTLQIIWITSKNASNKNCSELNFPPKTQYTRVHASLNLPQEWS